MGHRPLHIYSQASPAPMEGVVSANESKWCGTAGTVHDGQKAPHHAAVPRISYSGARGHLRRRTGTNRRCSEGLLFREVADVNCQGSCCFSARRKFTGVPPLSAPPTASQRGVRPLPPRLLIAVAPGLAEHVHGNRHDMHQVLHVGPSKVKRKRRSCAVVCVCIYCDCTWDPPSTRAHVVAHHFDR